jgi:hypothetical protein
MTRRTIATRVKNIPPIPVDTMPQLLDEKAAAQWLGVSVVSLRRGRSEGKTGGRTQMPPFVCVGGRVFYRLADLEAWVSSLRPREAV